MVEILTGGIKSRREKMFIDMICSAAAAQKKVLVVVPDQFSFEYDKMLYNRLGAQLFNGIKTTGFNLLGAVSRLLHGADDEFTFAIC